MNEKILIRIESHSKSGVGGMESRILEFSKILKNNYTFLTNSKFLIESKYFGDYNYIFSSYFNFWGILKDIFKFRNFYIIESNGLRDNIISSLNFLIFFPFYKIKKIKFFINIHGNQGILEMKGKQKFIYNFIFKMGLLIADKIIVISEELKFFLMKKYKISGKKIEIIENFINISNLPIEKKSDNNAMIVSRIDSHKIGGILKTIEFCLEKNINLDIYGSGELLEKLKERFKNKSNINFLGFKKQEEIKYKNYNIIFAMGRALLEGIANGLNGILIGYDDIIGEVSLENYKKIKFSNFSGRGVKKKEIILENISKDKIEIFNNIKNDFSLENLKNYYK